MSLATTARDRVAPLRVVIADDHPMFRAGIVRALEDDPRFRVVGEAGDGAEAEALIRAHDPELALLDLRMPGTDGLELLARLRHRAPPVDVVVLTAYTDTSLVHGAMDAGAAGYVAKDRDRAEILDVLADAAAGRRSVRVGEPFAAPRPHPRLSLRERTVLSLLNAGWEVDEVALLADMGPKTVAAHLANARRKLGAVTTRDAIAAAAAWGLLESGDDGA